jgi:hypothetical protein
MLILRLRVTTATGRRSTLCRVAPAGESLAEQLLPPGVEHDALVTTLSSFFPFGQWVGGTEVTYRTAEGQVGLTLIYGRKGLLEDVRRGPGRTDELLAELEGRVELLTSNSETVVWRDVFFTMPSPEGFWRYRDDWQIVPAPPEAPRPEFLMGDHPFIVELRLPWYPDEPMLSGLTQNRRAWELQLILNLVLNHRVLRFGPRVGDHSWVFLDEGGTPEARFLGPGYTIPGSTYQTTDFTPTDGIPPIREVSDDDYRSQFGFDMDKGFEMPAVLRPLLDHGTFQREALPRMRSRCIARANPAIPRLRRAVCACDSEGRPRDGVPASVGAGAQGTTSGHRRARPLGVLGSARHRSPGHILKCTQCRAGGGHQLASRSVRGPPCPAQTGSL